MVRFHAARAIAMNPTALERYRVLGLTLLLEGQMTEAVRVLREAAGMHGAGSYIGLGSVEQALEWAELNRVCP
jgi:hypothetical protein